MIAENQDTLMENEERPGSIPNRPPTYSELVELKIHTQHTRTNLEGIAGFLETLNLTYEFDKKWLDDAGHLCDEIVASCRERLKKMDAKKGRS